MNVEPLREIGRGDSTQNGDGDETEQNKVLEVSAAAGVLANDVKDDGFNLFVESYNFNGQGKLDMKEDGSFKYTPPSGYTGTGSFTYKACDSVTVIPMILDP